jgi:CRISPR-associated protein Csm4
MKGDTLFGQMCWAIRHLFGQERLAKLLMGYTEDRPYLIVSDPFPAGYLPKPTAPARFLGEDPNAIKKNRKKLWITTDTMLSGRFGDAKSDKEIDFEVQHSIEAHNALNYKTFRTGEGFDPFGFELYGYPSMEVYVLFDAERIDHDDVRTALSFVGIHGYGKKTTTGKGRFEVSRFEAVNLPIDGNVFVALSPLVLEGTTASKCYYDAFVRFGKHGNGKEKPNPFKRPILMAQTGAVLEYEHRHTLAYAGKGIGGISSAHPETVHQGYAIVTATGAQSWKP